jgi:Arc/MetJ family transcription regulator
VRTSIEIDDQLMTEALRLSGESTKRAVVEVALRLLIQTKAQTGIRKLHGKIQWEGDLTELRRSRVRN